MALPAYASPAQLAREIQRGTPLVALGQARSALRWGNPAAALTAVHRFLDRVANGSEPLPHHAPLVPRACAETLRGTALHHQGRDRESRAAMDRAVELFDHAQRAGAELDGFALADLATALTSVGRLDDAVDPAVRAAELGHGLPNELVITLGRYVRGAGRLDRVGPLLRIAVDAGPVGPELLELLAAQAPIEDAIDVHLAWVESLLEDHRVSEAVAVAERLDAVGRSGRATTAAVAAMVCAGQPGAAAKAYDQLGQHLDDAEHSDGRTRAWRRIAIVLAAAGEAKPPSDGPSLARVVCHLRTGHPEEALRELDQLGDDRLSLRLRAATNEALGRWKEATAAMRVLLDRSPGDSEVAAVAARLEAKAGHSVTALTEIEHRLADRPTDAALLGSRAAVLALRGDYRAAIDAAQRALEQAKPSLDHPRTARTALAAGLLGEGRPDASLAQVGKVLEHEPHDPDALYVRGKALLEQGAVHAAIDALTLLQSVAPWHRAGSGLLAEAYLQSGERERAIAEYERAVGRWPNDEELYLAAGRIALQAAWFTRAEGLLRSALEHRPDSAEAHAELGEVLRRAGDITQAERHIAIALQHDPERAAWIGTRGQIRLAAGDTEGGITLLREAVARQGDLGWARAELGEALRVNGRLTEAVRELSAAVGLNPDDPWPRAGRAAARLELHEFDQALKDITQTLKIDRGYAFAWSVKATAHMRMDDMDGAMAALDQAIEHDPDMEWAWATRAATRWLAEGNNAECVADLRRALDLDPNDVHARVALGFGLLRDGDRVAARAEFETVRAGMDKRRRNGKASTLDATVWALLGLAAWEEATELCAQVSLIDPGSVEFALNYGLAVLCASAVDPEMGPAEPDRGPYDAALDRARKQDDTRFAKHLLRLARRNLDDLEVAAHGTDHTDDLLAALALARTATEDARTKLKEG